MMQFQKVILAAIVSIFLCSGILNAQSYEILYDDHYNVPYGEYIFKLIKKSEISTSADRIIAKLLVRGEDLDINCYLFTPDQFELYQSGEKPENPIVWQQRKETMTIETTLTWQDTEKYYLVLSNAYSRLTDKLVYLFVVRIPQ